MSLPIRLAAGLLFLVLATSSAAAQGVLIPSDQRLSPLGLKHHRVSIEVKDGTAVTTIEQVWQNTTARPLEATYYFPVPQDAVLDQFFLWVNGVKKRGEVLEKSRANAIYAEIVRRVKDPGIVDWMGKGLFRARIFPIPPRGEQRVSISYSQVLPFVDGTYNLSYPLKTPKATASTLEDFTLTVKLSHRTPIKAIYSPSHKVEVSQRTDHEAIVGFEQDATALDRDFQLYFGVSDKDVGLNLLTYRPKANEPGYYLLMAAPRAVFNTKEIQGKRVTFVLDTSGSMTGIKMEQAKEAVKWAIERLGDDDVFNVVRFSSGVESFKSGPALATAANKRDAIAFVEQFEAAGGTNIEGALRATLAHDEAFPAGSGPHLVLFMTDGRPTVGETDQKSLVKAATARAMGQARIFSLGIGDDINTHLLDALASSNGGTSAYVSPSQDMAKHIAGLYNRIAYPVLTNIALTIPGVRTFDSQPHRLPDIFRGGQLVVVGRYRGDGDSLISLGGSLSGKSRQFDYEGSFPSEAKDHRFIATVWAHRQVGFLLDEIRLNGETSELKKEVIHLAKRYGIVTPYTSYLVVEGALPPQPPIGRIRPNLPPRPLIRHGRSGHHPNAPTPQPNSWEAEDTASGWSPTQRQAERTMLDAFGSGGGGGGTPGTLSAAGKTRPSLKKKSGSGAIRVSRAVNRLKNKETSTSDLAAVRRVEALGAVFTWRNGAWVDSAVPQAATGRIRIKAFGTAWMTLASRSPGLKAALALGQRVIIQLGNQVLEVGSDGQDSLDDRAINRLIQAAKARG